MDHRASSQGRVRHAKPRVIVVPPNYDSGLLLADDEARI